MQMLKKLIKKEDFTSFLADNQNKIVLVKFSTEWCPPCRVLQKSIQELLTELEQSAEPKNNLVVLEIDADHFPQLEYKDQAQKNQQLIIHSVPTLFLFQKGEMVKKAVGSMSIQQLKEFINI
ncbi:MAG: thioredoxin family protein [Candidatus Moeniiplasma glomeromycotorum]|nr:thioredoxin family protein [Candidatus Moeniiplasma glomeromycotorum]MCE8169939.1 thioredoxin family protein [Candidatus Moeniiplasma glomeromycotorum]